MNRRARLEAWRPAQVHRECVSEVAEAFGFPTAAMVSRSRRSAVIEARHAGYWVVKQRFPRLTWEQVGKLFGGRDHSTVIEGNRRAEERRVACTIFRERTDILAEGRPIEGPPPSILRAQADAQRREREREAARIDRQRRLRRIAAEIAAFPEPKPHLLGIQLKGQDGCPRLSEDEIARRRDAVEAARRDRELALLELEAARYGLPRRGLASWEMAA